MCVDILYVPGVFMLCVHAVSSSAITTGQPSKCAWLLIQLPYGGVYRQGYAHANQLPQNKFP